MNRHLKNQSMIVNRADIQSGLRALFLTQLRIENIAKEDMYAAGFNEGYQTALLSVGQMFGVSEALVEYRIQHQGMLFTQTSSNTE